MNPSSIGISFVVASMTTAVNVVFKWGEYHKLDGSMEVDEDAAQALVDAEANDELAKEDGAKTDGTGAKQQPQHKRVSPSRVIGEPNGSLM